MPAPLDALFNPAAVAVVGATPDLSKPGGRCLAALRRHGFQGAIYPISPKHREIDGLPCYGDFVSLPTRPDLVVLLVPAAAVPDYLRMAGVAGAKAAVVCSGGFAESGADGAALQAQIVAIAKEHEMAVLGPNSLGFVDLVHKVTATFTTAMNSPEPRKLGRIAFLSQSGGMGSMFLRLAHAEGIGFNKVVSTGNESVLQYADLLEHFAQDPSVDLVLGFVEGLSQGRKFIRAARQARAAGKDVAILKVGESDAGMKAARSHTGSLVGSAQIYEAAFRRAGVLKLNDVRDLLDLALVPTGVCRPRGSRVGIVSVSGGAAVLLADKCHAAGLAVTPLTQTTQQKLAKVLPEFAARGNPVDIGPVYGSPESMEAAIEHVVADPDVDSVLAYLIPAPGLEERLANVQSRHGKPILVALLAAPSTYVTRMRELGVAAYEDLGRAVTVAALLRSARLPVPVYGAPALPSETERTRATREALRAYLAAGRTALTERETKTLLLPYGIPVVAEVLASNETEAEAIGRRFGRRLAVKAEAPELLHKSDAGAVRLNVMPDNVAEAFREVVAAATSVVGRAGVRGALIQPMAPPGVEILAGLRFDSQFGPTITVGLGGVASEVLADVVTELAPLDLSLAREMLARLRGAALLGPFRGAPPRDADALAKMLVALADFAMDAGDLLAELDLNPVLSHAERDGCTVVDAVAVLRPEGLAGCVA